MPKLTTLRLRDEQDLANNLTERANPVSRRDPLQYAFLALLAFNIFLAAGGASFALLYFSR